MPTPRDWTENLTERRPKRRHSGLCAELIDLAEPACESCDGTGVTPAGDVCGCVDW